MKAMAFFVSIALAGCAAEASDEFPAAAEVAEPASDLTFAAEVPTAPSSVDEAFAEIDAIDEDAYGNPGSDDLELASAGYVKASPSYGDEDRSFSFDEDRARDDARREAYRRGYQGFCTSDCSGHEAGFNWAYENRLRRPAPTYDSESFDEGQSKFFKDVERRIEEKRSEFESDPEYSEYSDEE